MQVSVTEDKSQGGDPQKKEATGQAGWNGRINLKVNINSGCHTLYMEWSLKKQLFPRKCHKSTELKSMLDFISAWGIKESAFCLNSLRFSL